MNQKIWVISDEEWEKGPAKNRSDGRADDYSPGKTRTAQRPALPQKSPALSFSLSMIIWGSGQIYNRDYGSGWKFMSAMAFFYAVIASLVFFRTPVRDFIVGSDLPAALTVNVLLVFFISAVISWLWNAVDAYYRATASRSEPYRRVGNGFWPLLCSFLFPGWGQFLNGQPGKGIFFLLFGLAGVFSVFILLVTRALWPFLAADQDRLAIEIYFAAALAAIPPVSLMWLVAMFDAFGSWRELARRRPGFPYGGSGRRRQGTVMDLVPRGTVVLGLLVAISAGAQFIPKSYYLDSLEKIRLEMRGNHMKIVPEALGKLISFLDR